MFAVKWFATDLARPGAELCDALAVSIRGFSEQLESHYQASDTGIMLHCIIELNHAHNVKSFPLPQQGSVESETE